MPHSIDKRLMKYKTLLLDSIYLFLTNNFCYWCICNKDVVYLSSQTWEIRIILWLNCFDNSLIKKKIGPFQVRGP